MKSLLVPVVAIALTSSTELRSEEYFMNRQLNKCNLKCRKNQYCRIHMNGKKRCVNKSMCQMI